MTMCFLNSDLRISLAQIVQENNLWRRLDGTAGTCPDARFFVKNVLWPQWSSTSLPGRRCLIVCHLIDAVYELRTSFSIE